ncbi:MAG: ABC transporter permease [Cyclobacteriaceae bacterium]
MNRHPSPPKKALRFLRWFCRDDYLEEIEGNLLELYEQQYEESSAKARRQFRWNVLRHFRPAFIRSFKMYPTNTFDMFTSYFIIALRLFTRNRLISSINVLGLALALTGSLLIMLFILDEVSYDRHHTNADCIYRVTRNFLSPDGSETLHVGLIAPPFGPLLQNDFSDIVEVARTRRVYRPLTSIEEDGSIQESLCIVLPYYAEPSVFTLFTIPILAGDTKTPLEKPYTMLISDATAQQYFGTQDVVGKRVKAEDVFFEITGGYKAFPTQSHWHPDVLVAFSTLNNQEIYGWEQLETNWGNNDFSTYILVNDQFDAQRIQQQFPNFLDKHMRGLGKPSEWTSLFLQPLTSIHLYSQLNHEIEVNGSIDHVYIMGAIGVFLLLIAIFNFINLATARATIRTKEVGLRKVLGAFRRQLVAQHLSESTLVALVAFLMALILTWLALPWLNEFTDKSIRLAAYIHPIAGVAGLCLVLLVGLLAGFYPALIISRFNPVRLLKQRTGSGTGKQGIRRGLVVVQFTLSIMMIIATVIIYQQLQFLNDRELGYAKDQIVRIDYDDDLADRYETFYHELTNHTAIKSASRSSLIPTGRLLDFQGTSVQQGDSLVATDITMIDVRVDPEFFATYQIPLISGRNFSQEIKSDDSLAFIINETAAQMVGWANDEAIGQVLQNGSVKGTVIGVVKDFHFESLHESIVPVVFHGQPYFNHVSIQVSAQDMPEALVHMEAVWKKFTPDKPFYYSFLSDRYQQLYVSEQRQSELFIIFAGMAIFIAAIGLFGLATFNTLQRVKEIGIRKALGASVAHILGLLSREILLILVLANGIAWPLAWYFMNEWLGQFAYGIEPTWWMFALAGLLAALIALLTISYQSINAALANPVDALRNE